MARTFISYISKRDDVIEQRANLARLPGKANDDELCELVARISGRVVANGKHRISIVCE